MIARGNEADPLIAYAYGDTPPDFVAIAAMGFEAVCIDSRARWYRSSMIGEAERLGLLAVAHAMSFVTTRISSSPRNRRPSHPERDRASR